MYRRACTLLSVLFTAVTVGVPDDDVQPVEPVAIGKNTKADVVPVSIDEARRQAALLHQIYVTTLMVVHREYFDEKQRNTLPARAFEEVFEEIDAITKGHTRWIAVNTPAMNVDHEPNPGFETSAAVALSKGEKFIESAADGFYRRAVGIPFAASSSKCHQSALGNRRAGRMAGLVISIPVRKEKDAEP